MSDKILGRHLKYHGKDATVKNFTEGSTDEYGDPSYTESTTDTKVIIDRSPADRDVFESERGEEVRASADIYVDSDISLSDGNDGSRPTEITVDGFDYQALVLDPQPSGLTRVLSQRI